MNVNLTPELEELIHDKVNRGPYASASEVVQEALRLLEERDQDRDLRIRELRNKIDQGLASLERGEGVDGEEFFKALEREEQEPERKRA